MDIITLPALSCRKLIWSNMAAMATVIPVTIIIMDIISSITPVEGPRPETTTLWGQRVIAGFGIVVCCGLLMLAVPRFVASLYALYPEAAFKQTQEAIPPEIYEKSINDLNQALSWYQNPDYWQLKGFFYVALYNALPFQALEKKQALLYKAQAAIIQGLTLSPIDPYGWFRLAAIDDLLKLPRQQIINALRLSIYAGRVEPELIMSRLAFSYDYYNDFNEEMQGLWRKQVLVARAFQPAQLTIFVAQHPEARQLVEKAFDNSPDDWKKFSHDLELYLQKIILFKAK